MTDLGIESPDTIRDPVGNHPTQSRDIAPTPPPPPSPSRSQSQIPQGSLPVTGFVAGILSGVTKLVIGHPFDTLKVRLQVSGERFNHSVLQCLKSTVQKEGLKGLYKGGTPPLFGWALMDSVMLGSLSQYRRLLAGPGGDLSLWQHTLSGLGAGMTVSLVATPIEHVKARLQVQYDASSRLFRGPVEATMKLVRGGQLYQGLTATLLQRSWFSVFWASYAVTTTRLERTSLSQGSVSFIAGGVASTVYWCFAFPFDVVKQRIMTDDLKSPKYAGWRDCWTGIWRRDGWRGYYRGFTPCILRAFPTNASAVFVFDTAMRYFGTFGF